MEKNHANTRFAFVQWASLVLIGLFLSSCSDNSSAPAKTTTPTGKLIIKGSNTIGEELAPRLIAAYKKEHPSADFELESKATGYGLAALLAGQCDLAGASRTPIKEEEELAKARAIELNDHLIGYYSVAVVVNSGSPITNLTREQVRDIFTGKIQNWKEVGGTDAPIHLKIRDPISGTHLGFKELAMENQPYGSVEMTYTNYAGITRSVAQDTGAIGYCSLELADKSGVKPVSIQGVLPVNATVIEGKYPYGRALHFYTTKGNESAATQDFLKFVLSAPGQEILSQMGFVPHS